MEHLAKLLVVVVLALNLGLVTIFHDVMVVANVSACQITRDSSIYLPLVMPAPGVYLVGIEDWAQADEIVAALEGIGATVIARSEHARYIAITLPLVNNPFGWREIIARIEQIPGVRYVTPDVQVDPLSG